MPFSPAKPKIICLIEFPRNEQGPLVCEFPLEALRACLLCRTPGFILPQTTRFALRCVLNAIPAEADSLTHTQGSFAFLIHSKPIRGFNDESIESRQSSTRARGFPFRFEVSTTNPSKADSLAHTQGTSSRVDLHAYVAKLRFKIRAEANKQP